jgi:hypothetical protein
MGIQYVNEMRLFDMFQKYFYLTQPFLTKLHWQQPKFGMSADVEQASS